MDAYRRLRLAGWGVAVALVIAGCATAVSGSPRAAVTDPSPLDTPTVTAASSPSLSASVTTSPPTPTPQAPSSSAVRPMPPLTPAVSASAGTAAGSDTIAGVDLADVLADLSKSHVAWVGTAADTGTLVSLVDGARVKGLQLSVVSIGLKIDDDDTSTIAQRLFDSTGGTLLVLSPSLVSARSDQLTDAQRDNAVKAAAAGKSDAEAVTRFIGAALAGAGVTGGASTSASSAPTTHPKVGGVDIDGIVAALGADHIAIGSGVTEVTAAQLAVPVQKAWKGGIKLSVAILDKDPTGHLYDVASAVMGVAGGTVVVISPERYAIASDTVDDAKLQAAIDAAAHSSTYLAVVTDMVNSMLS